MSTDSIIASWIRRPLQTPCNILSVKKFSSFSLSYPIYLGEECYSSKEVLTPIKEINLKCSSHVCAWPQGQGYFANKSIFIHLPCRQCILSVFTLLWIRPLATVHKTNNNFTYHHKLHFHTNIQMGVEIVPTSFVKGKENHSYMRSSSLFTTLHYTNSHHPHQYLESHAVHYWGKKKTEFKNDLIPAIVMSHLQKRLSNCHCPCKKGFSDTNILFNMKHFMYLKILEVFRCKHCFWHDCMYAQTQTIVTVFYFHFAASFFLHFMSVTITFTQPGVTHFQH